jgi:hypothetical protein
MCFPPFIFALFILLRWLRFAFSAPRCFDTPCEASNLERSYALGFLLYWIEIFLVKMKTSTQRRYYYLPLNYYYITYLTTTFGNGA